VKLNWANRITILRILLIIPFVSCMLKINDIHLSANMQSMMRYISCFMFFLMAISDGIDGYLARKKGQVTKLGAFLDPTADKLLMMSACLLLASEKAGVVGFRLPQTVVVLIVGKDLFLLLGFIIVFFITTEVRIVPVFIGKVATVLQMVMVSAILLAPEISSVLGWWIWFLRVVWWSAAGTAIIATLIYILAGSRYTVEYEHRINNKV
jgi:CDP-diacylglycerol--glycerol-3-phosphate 3-phosphatidyltransferase